MKRSFEQFEDSEALPPFSSNAKLGAFGARFAMKFLLHPSEMGVLSPEIADVEHMTRASLEMSAHIYPGTDLQEVIVRGADTDVVVSAIIHCLTKIIQATGALTNGEPGVLLGHGRFKTAVPTKAAAAVIGKGGANIIQLRAISQCHVHLDRNTVPPEGGETAEQVVALSGSLLGIQAALPNLAEHIAALVQEPWFHSWASVSRAGMVIPGLQIEYSGKGQGGMAGKGGRSNDQLMGFSVSSRGTTFPAGAGAPCQFFARAGWCKFGDQCRNAHSSDGSVPPPMLGPCGTEVCQFFARSGWCKFADACKYEHALGAGVGAPQAFQAQLQPLYSDLAPVQPPQFAVGDEYAAMEGMPGVGIPAGIDGGSDGADQICQFFAKAGWCKWAGECKHRHVRVDLEATPPPFSSASSAGGPPPQSSGEPWFRP